MHVSILVPAGHAIISSIVGPYEILDFVNQHLITTNQIKDNFYDIDFVGLNHVTSFHQGAIQIKPTKTIQQIQKTDLIIITTPYGNLENEIENNKEFFPWIREMHEMHDCDVASLCIGAFLLAATGLVNGKSCTTHWSATTHFRKIYPEVNLLPEKILVEEGGIYSSGGSYSYLNLMLYLVEKYNGFDLSKLVAKIFEIDINRQSQAPFIIFEGQKSHEDLIVRDVQDFLENNYTKTLSLDDLAVQFHISKRNLIRRFKKATANTPFQYLQRVKIEAAKRKLEQSNSPIMEIMFETGYNDVKSFRKAFKKYSGLSPTDYRVRYSRN